MIDSIDTNENDTNCPAEKVRDDKCENLDQVTTDITSDLIKLKHQTSEIFFRPKKLAETSVFAQLNTTQLNLLSELELAEPSLEYTIIEASDDSNYQEEVEQFDDEPNQDSITVRNDVSTVYPDHSIVNFENKDLTKLDATNLIISEENNNPNISEISLRELNELTRVDNLTVLNETVIENKTNLNTNSQSELKGVTKKKRFDLHEFVKKVFNEQKQKSSFN